MFTPSLGCVLDHLNAGFNRVRKRRRAEGEFVDSRLDVLNQEHSSLICNGLFGDTGGDVGGVHFRVRDGCARSVGDVASQGAVQNLRRSRKRQHQRTAQQSEDSERPVRHRDLRGFRLNSDT
jgi:hypothetical protein